jgi:Xaa-Pro aminopeptidase
MKSDLDGLMQARNLDALLVTGPGRHNPAMVYLTGGANLSEAELIKKRGAEPVLFYNLMEREEAALTGLETKNLGDYHLEFLIKKFDGDLAKALAARYQNMLADLSIRSGRVGIYGISDPGSAYAVFSELSKAAPGLELVGEPETSVLLEAMRTKDEAEVARIRRMGQITVEVVAATVDFVSTHKVRDRVLIGPEGSPLTVADVKSRINLWLAERGAENPEGTIFAVASEAAVPHSMGRDADFLRTGVPIVFDIFPCEAGGGYFYDLTRTWCLGYAPDEVYAVYKDVLDVYNQIVQELRPGELCKNYQQRACELFERRGHMTVRNDASARQGYVHGLGHGVGLNIHERPSFAGHAGEDDHFVPGVVFTIEPGLYYPELNLGVRLENTFWMRPDGQFEKLVDFPMDLVLPLE